MIKFDASLISIDIVPLKAVSTALGGSITLVDQKKSTPAKEVLKRMEVPMSVARSFIQRHKKTTKYLKPVFTAVVRYDNRVIALERHPLGSLGQLEDDGLFGKKTWQPAAADNIDKLIVPLAVYSNDRDWYFDGRYMYSFDAKDVQSVVSRAQRMSKNGCFRKIHTLTVDLQQLHNKDKLQPADRTCVAFVASNGQYSISPPIWKDVSDIGTTQQRKGGHLDDADGEMQLSIIDNENSKTVKHETLDQFDTIDEHLAVNLNFALKAGIEIGQLFGYEAVEPLHMPRLMIELHTVNLPNIAKEVKATYDIGLNFTHAVAWLLGMQKRTNTLEGYLVVRSLLKYLTSKGIFRRNIFDAERVFKTGKVIKDVPQLDIAELLKGSNNRLSLAAMVEQVRSNKRKHHADKGMTNVGTLMNEGD